VIFCAGRTTADAGEARFLGRGIAFCATCDAPLFSGKRVVVVGGGNSAFSAARDLLPYAAEIHLVNILPDWQADGILQSAVAGRPNVTLHPATRVTGFLGETR
jgi:alkyl hydroperoxide reductase subunit F